MGPWAVVRSKLDISERGRVHCLLPIEEVLAHLLEFRPHVLRGFPTVLTNLSHILTKCDRNVIEPRLVITGAEIVTAEMRRKMMEGFRSPVLDLYGAHEFPLIGYECKHSGKYHLCEEALIAEILHRNIS